MRHVILMAAFVLLGPALAAQDITGLWLKARVAVRGLVPTGGVTSSLGEVGEPPSLDGKATNVKRRTTVYIHLTELDGDGSYDIEVWYPTPLGLQLDSDFGYIEFGTDGVVRGYEFGVPILGKVDGVVGTVGGFELIGNGELRLTFDGEGGVKKGKFTSSGCEAEGFVQVGEDDSVPVVGAARIRARVVPPEKLPPFAQN